MTNSTNFIIAVMLSPTMRFLVMKDGTFYQKMFSRPLDTLLISHSDGTSYYFGLISATEVNVYEIDQ